MSNISIPASKLLMYVNYAPIKDTYVQLQYLHTGKRDRFSPNASGVYQEGEGPVKRINLLNLMLGAKVKAWDFSLAISNLLNNTYYTPSSMLMARNAEYAHADGRKVTLTATFKF